MVIFLPLNVVLRSGSNIFNSRSWRITAMAEKIKECHCEKCGNEAEMTISCQMVEVRTASGEMKQKQRETRTCKVCGNEADLIIDFD
jgi:hypothetical protein